MNRAALSRGERVAVIVCAALCAFAAVYFLLHAVLAEQEFRARMEQELGE